MPVYSRFFYRNYRRICSMQQNKRKGAHGDKKKMHCNGHLGTRRRHCIEKHKTCSENTNDDRHGDNGDLEDLQRRLDVWHVEGKREPDVLHAGAK